MAGYVPAALQHCLRRSERLRLIFMDWRKIDLKNVSARHLYLKEERGIAKTRLYVIWTHMKQRCYNRNSNKYHIYGARGISVCEEWKNDFRKFRKWALNNGYKEHLTLDRVDYNGNYEPSNCRWATAKEQGNNMRSNHLLTMDGETHTISEWSDITGIKRGTIERRINKYGWDVISALTIMPGEVWRFGT